MVLDALGCHCVLTHFQPDPWKADRQVGWVLGRLELPSKSYLPYKRGRWLAAGSPRCRVEW